MKSLEYVRRFRRNISVRGILNAFIHYKSLRKLDQADILYFCHDNSRPIYMDKKYFSPLIDTINICLKNRSNLTMAIPFSKYSGKKAYGNTVNLNLHIIIALIKRYLRIFKGEDPLIVFYTKLLKQIDAKVVIGVQPSVELCLAAEKKGIEVFDVQHGVIEIENKLSYYSLSKRKAYKNKGWPTTILCRNQLTVDRINKLLTTHTKPYLIGNLNHYFYNHIYKSETEPPFNNGKKVVLFTYQPIYHKEFEQENHHHGITFPNYVLDIIKNTNYNFLIKFHPSQIRNKDTFKKYVKALDIFLNFAKDRVDYRLCNESPLEYSLIHSDLHITFNSACLFDAMDYGLKTILIDDNNDRLENFFGHLLDSSFVKLATSNDVELLNELFKETNKDIIKEKTVNLNSFVDYIENKLN